VKRNLAMKRLIVAAALSALAVPAFAVEIGKPFEQTELDPPAERVDIAAFAAKELADRLCARLAERGVRGKRQRAVVDQAAAVEILQSWLDAQRRQR